MEQRILTLVCPCCYVYSKSVEADERHGDFWVGKGSLIVDPRRYQNFPGRELPSGKRIPSWRDSHEFKAMRNHVADCITLRNRRSCFSSLDDPECGWHFYMKQSVLKQIGVLDQNSAELKVTYQPEARKRVRRMRSSKTTGSAIFETVQLKTIFENLRKLE